MIFMPGRPKTKEGFKKQTIEIMTGLGIYRPFFDPIIEDYAELCAQHEIHLKEYHKSDYACEIDTGQGGRKKSPLVATIETERKDILAYSDRLGLNPKALESIKLTNGKQSGALNELLKSI